MNVDQELIKYLRGDLFSNSLEVLLPTDRQEGITREDAIVNLIKGTDVIHVGCSDHIPLIQDKIKHNTWLHKNITEASKSCIGIDIDRESIEFLKNELGYQNVIHGDIVTDDIPVLKEKQWDYVVFGEIIEHLNSPVDFLRTFRSKYGSNVKKFVITVPNIYNRNIMKNMLSFKEIINSDHKFWFTPYTLAKVLVTAGFMPEKISYTNASGLSKVDLARRKLKKIFDLQVKYPFYYFSSLIATGNIN
ncbi:MAG: hypothetical protein NT092_01300 [Bacteroidia bacterium]|nr:hypothetical protein [Bacteroidia bacterium]